MFSCLCLLITFSHHIKPVNFVSQFILSNLLLSISTISILIQASNSLYLNNLCHFLTGLSPLNFTSLSPVLHTSVKDELFEIQIMSPSCLALFSGCQCSGMPRLIRSVLRTLSILQACLLPFLFTLFS